jgi:putative ABC transport system permease protein
MLRSFLTITFRILWRNKVTSFVNIFSLSVGITAFIFIMLYVHHETSYDKFNEKYDRIYRVEADDYAKLPYTAGELLKDRLPEVEDVALLTDGGKQLFAYSPEDDPEKSVQTELKFYWANSSVFNVFTLPFVKGDPNTALTNPLVAVLTESTAHKIFGDVDPMNKTIEFKNQQFVITGIIKDVEQSHIEIDALLSQESLERVYSWQYKSIRTIEHSAFIWSGTYLLLNTTNQANQLENKINAVLADFNNGVNISVLFKRFHLRSLRDIYFNGNLHNLTYGLHGNFKMVQTLIALGIFLLILAVINYVNLTTARSTIRVKEVAIKRVSGSSAGQMRYQLILESIFISIVSLVVAITLVQLILPNFNLLANTNIKTENFNRPGIWGLVFGGSVLQGIIAGLYPSFYLTAINPVRLIKGEGVKGSSGSFFRSILMTFQFALSVVMIVAIVVNARQLHYVRTADLGFAKDHIISIVTPEGSDIIVKRNAFKERLIQSGFEKVSYCSGAPGFEELTAPMQELNGQKTIWKTFVADSDYLKVMGIEVIKGRGFSPKFPADQAKWIPHTRVGGAIINEAAVREFGLEEPIGQMTYQADSTRHMLEIIGVVKDFHYRSFHDKIEPLIILWWPRPYDNVLIKLHSDDIPESLAKIEQEWKEVFGQAPFAYKFLDENFDQQYKADEQLAKVIGYFTAIAVIIACLGLFALSSFMVSRRVKEIGVRKVLGASVGTIYSMLSWDFLKWILVAIVVASPVAWFLMKMWLSTFAYHITLGVDVFVIAALIAIGIALLTVTGQSLKVARANPVDSLKYE